MERINELIRKFNIQIATQNGVEGMRVWGKPTQKEMAELKEKKPEIMAELHHRAKERAEREAREKAEKEAELQELKEGKKKITLRYYDGEYLWGFMAVGQEAELLAEIGVAEYVSGWGYHVSDKAVEALGEEFTYAEAVEYIRPAREAEAKRVAEKEAERQAKFDEAKATGEPVLLRRWTEECCNPREECSMDIHYQYAMPDGSIKHKWNHTW